jgi:hypothetical protein
MDLQFPTMSLEEMFEAADEYAEIWSTQLSDRLDVDVRTSRCRRRRVVFWLLRGYNDDVPDQLKGETFEMSRAEANAYVRRELARGKRWLNQRAAAIGIECLCRKCDGIFGGAV